MLTVCFYLLIWTAGVEVESGKKDAQETSFCYGLNPVGCPAGYGKPLGLYWWLIHEFISVYLLASAAT